MRGAAQAERPLAAPVGKARHHGLHDVVRVRRHDDVRLATRVLPGPVGVDQDLDRTGGGARGQPVRYHLRRPRLTEPQDYLRRMRVGEALHAEQGVGGRDGGRARLAGGPGT